MIGRVEKMGEMSIFISMDDSFHMFQLDFHLYFNLFLKGVCSQWIILFTCFTFIPIIFSDQKEMMIGIFEAGFGIGSSIGPPLGSPIGPLVRPPNKKSQKAKQSYFRRPETLAPPK